MFDESAIQKIADLATEGRLATIGGIEFHVNEDRANPVKFPTRETLKCFSLSQFVNALKWILIDETKTNEDGRQEVDNNLLVNVDSFERVAGISFLRDENEEIEEVAVADFKGVFETFPFKTQLSHEEFIINLLTKFEKTEQLTALLKQVSSVKQERLQTSEDDGVSQVAATKTGVHLSSQTQIQSMWTLKTFKTFPEVDQPEIPYILRLHQRDEEMPKFALYECDGGMWKVRTTLAVREWLQNRIKNELGELASKVTVL